MITLPRNPGFQTRAGSATTYLGRTKPLSVSSALTRPPAAPAPAMTRPSSHKLMSHPFVRSDRPGDRPKLHDPRQPVWLASGRGGLEHRSRARDRSPRGGARRDTGGKAEVPRPREGVRVEGSRAGRRRARSRRRSGREAVDPGVEAEGLFRSTALPRIPGGADPGREDRPQGATGADRGRLADPGAEAACPGVPRVAINPRGPHPFGIPSPRRARSPELVVIRTSR